MYSLQEHSKFAAVGNKFASSFDVVEEELRSSTIGEEDTRVWHESVCRVKAELKLQICRHMNVSKEFDLENELEFQAQGVEKFSSPFETTN